MNLPRRYRYWSLPSVTGSWVVCPAPHPTLSQPRLPPHSTPIHQLQCDEDDPKHPAAVYLPVGTLQIGIKIGKINISGIYKSLAGIMDKLSVNIYIYCVIFSNIITGLPLTNDI